jgi:hypothetical protein
MLTPYEENLCRRFLWINHGCNIGLYGDDGEMQCNNTPVHVSLDFKRDSIIHIFGELSKIKAGEK